MPEKMGISQAAYSRMENPDDRLRWVTIEKIIGALRIEFGTIDGQTIPRDNP